MRRTVILLHTLPSGDSHFDWLIDQPEIPTEHRLISLRCNIRPDSADLGSFSATRLPDHRAYYLRFEGELTDSRGSVARLADGEVISYSRTKNTLNLSINWEIQALTYNAQRDLNHPNVWNFSTTIRQNPLDE